MQIFVQSTGRLGSKLCKVWDRMLCLNETQGTSKLVPLLVYFVEGFHIYVHAPFNLATPNRSCQVILKQTRTVTGQANG